MALSKLFWLLTIILFVLLGMHVYSMPVLEAILGVVAIMLVTLKVTQDDVNNKFARRFSMDVKEKMEEFVSSFSELTNFLKGERSSITQSPNKEIVTLGAIQNGLDRHKDDLKNDFKNSMDRMAKKTIEIENRLTNMNKVFSAAVASLDDRVRVNEIDDAEDEYVHLIPE